jgi:hypothetical protein
MTFVTFARWLVLAADEQPSQEKEHAFLEHLFLKLLF